MNDIGNWSDAEGPRRSAAGRSTAWAWVAGTAVTALAALFWVGFSYREGGQTAAATVPPAQVTVSNPLVRDVDTRIGLLGQFSAIDRVELRAQVGGTLTEIHFQDGQIVHKGDHLFVMRSRLYPARMRSISSSRHFSWQLNRGGCSTYRTGIPVQTIQATSVVHHQGAIEMARAELRYGHNEQLRRLAQEIIVTQQQEIAAMRLAVGQPLPPSVPSPDQLSRTERIDAKSGFEHSPPGKEP